MENMSRRARAHGYSLLVLAVLVCPMTRLAAQAQPLPGGEWAQFSPGAKVELDVVCLGSWKPVTLLKADADPSGRPGFKSYTIRRQDGSEWTFVAPGRVAPCGRAAGGIARDRAALPAPQLGVYNCNYQGQVVPVFDFALLSRSVYRDYDGARGNYRYDTSTRQLAFLTGPKSGTRAQQVSAKTFQFLSNGLPTGNYCPHNPSRDPNGRHL